MKGWDDCPSLFLIIKRGLLDFDEGLRRVFAGEIPVVTFLVLVAEKLTKSCDYGQWQRLKLGNGIHTDHPPFT